MREKKSDFILSVSFSLSHMRLRARARCPISGGEERVRGSSKLPLEIFRVFLFMTERGRVMLSVIPAAMRMPMRSDEAAMTRPVLSALVPAFANPSILFLVSSSI
ncbi:MAG: hypothetical protein A4E61_01215 [Syntrophorhabdus sp. PtaB.Bin184]|nr:MAG: hypothetical protein A4E61_01215 [Syntrophorhabdus sp. PtaB.Bin184]